MKKPVVMLDMDGVLADFSWGFTGIAKKLGLIPEQYGTVTQSTYGFDDIPGRDRAKVWKEIINDRFFWKELPSLLQPKRVPSREEHALYNLQFHADLYFVTARLGRSCKRQTEQWLLAHGIYWPTVIVLDGRTGGPAPQSPQMKKNISHAIGADFSLDDKPEIVEAIAENKDCRSYMRSWEYNSEVKYKLRVDSFLNFAHLIFKEVMK